MKIRQYKYEIYEEYEEFKVFFRDLVIFSNNKKEADKMIEYYLNKMKELYNKNYYSTYIRYYIVDVNYKGILNVEELIKAQYKIIDEMKIKY